MMKIIAKALKLDKGVPKESLDIHWRWRDQVEIDDFELACRLQSEEERISGRVLDSVKVTPCAPELVYDVTYRDLTIPEIIPPDMAHIKQLERIRMEEEDAKYALKLQQAEAKYPNYKQNSVFETNGFETDNDTNYTFMSQDAEKESIYQREKEDAKYALIEQQAEERRIQKLLEERRNLEESDALMAYMFQQEEENRRTKKFVCDICMDECHVDGSYELECEHRFCQECLLNYFSSKTLENQIDTIKCPNCDVCISQDIVLGTLRDCKRRDIIEKYEEKASWNMITKCKQFIHCPNENCNNYTEWDPRIQGFAYSCASCKHDYCLRCQVNPHCNNTFSMGHKGRTCKQQREQIEKDAKEKKKHEEWKALNASAEIRLKEYIDQSGIKICPSCNYLIERNEGCDHMTCRMCKTNFCYICGKYDKNNPTGRGDCGATCKNKPK